MKEFYVTFGYKYANTPHPLGVHPYGYMTIVAPDYGTARQKAFDLTGGKFAFIYEKLPDPAYFPLGEIRRVTVGEKA